MYRWKRNWHINRTTYDNELKPLPITTNIFSFCFFQKNSKYLKNHGIPITIKNCQNHHILTYLRLLPYRIFPNKNLNLSHSYVQNVLNFVALPLFSLLLLSMTVFNTISSARCFRSEISLLWLEMKKLNELLYQFILNHTHTLLIYSLLFYIGVFFVVGHGVVATES